MTAVVPLGFESVPASVGGEVSGARAAHVHHDRAEAVGRRAAALAAPRAAPRPARVQRRQSAAQPPRTHQRRQFRLHTPHTSLVPHADRVWPRLDGMAF